MKVSGWKVFTAGLVSILTGVAGMLGVVDVDWAAFGESMNTAVAGVMTFYGVLMIVLRKFTTTPIFTPPEEVVVENPGTPAAVVKKAGK
jgi:predicted Kef-type K+ transport protein